MRKKKKEGVRDKLWGFMSSSKKLLLYLLILPPLILSISFKVEAVEFYSPTPYSTGSQPTSVATGDFNQDGYPDIVVGYEWGYAVSILMNNGDGTFSGPFNYSAGFCPRAVAAGDLNNDGYPDIVVAYGPSSVAVLINNGDGTFGTLYNYNLSGGYPDSVAIGDFNRDGYLDFAVNNGGLGNISVFINNGDGTFAGEVSYGGGSYNVVSLPLTSLIVSDDLDSDGYPDLAVANGGMNTSSILHNNGDGTFAGEVSYPAGSSPSSITTGDFNQDGYPDLAIANYMSDNIAVLISMPVNQPPIADAGIDQDIYLGEIVQLDGFNSSDPDGDPIVSYNWTIESAPAGSTASLSDSTIVNPTFTPDLEGQYIISLVVNDGVDDSAADTVSINVTLNLPPVATATGNPLSGNAPLTVSFDASGSNDPEGGSLTYNWDFGDPSSSNNTSILPNPTHTYNNVGTYTAIVTVTDDFNNTDQASVIIEVTAPNQPPTVNPVANPSSGVAPLTVQFTANAVDPEGVPLTYLWDFGDGTSVSSEANPGHIYTTPGTYIVSIVVSDGEFDVNGEITISVSSPLSIDVTQASVDRGKKGKVEGKVNLKANFVYSGLPDSSDLIVVTFDGVTLVEEPFGSFEGGDESGKYRYKEKDIHVNIDFNKGTIKVSRHKMVLTGIDNSNGIDVVISFGDSTGTDHFVMKEKGGHEGEEDEKKLSYKDKDKD